MHSLDRGAVTTSGFVQVDRAVIGDFHADDYFMIDLKRVAGVVAGST
jgi:hypothetical protein